MVNFWKYLVCIQKECVFGSCVLLYLLIKSSALIILFKCSVSLLVFCLLRSVIKKSMSKSSSILAGLSIFPWSSDHLCFIKFETMLLSIYKFKIFMSFCQINIFFWLVYGWFLKNHILNFTFYESPL